MTEDNNNKESPRDGQSGTGPKAGPPADPSPENPREDKSAPGDKARMEEELKELLFTKPPRERLGRGGLFGCMATVTGLIMLLFFIFISASTGFIKGSLLSPRPIEMEPITLTEEEQKDLEEKLETYRNALRENIGRDSARPAADFEMILSTRQINSILQGMKPSTEPEGLWAIRINPAGSGVKIAYSTPFGREKYFNVEITGKPTVRDFILRMEVESLKVGKLGRAAKFKDRITAKLNRYLESEPTRLRMPFFIREMDAGGSQVRLLLRFRQGMHE
jgi:hypothetical protein